MNRGIIWFAAVLAITATAGTAAAGALDDVKAGIAATRSGDAEEAIDFFTRALQSRDLPADDQAIAYHNRGLAYSDLLEYDKAIADHDAAIHLRPDVAEVYADRGDAHDHKGDFDRAIADYDAAIRLKPDLVEAYDRRGNDYNRKHQYDLAIADYDMVIRLMPDAPESGGAYFNRAALFTIKGDFARALADYDAVIRLDPEDNAVNYYVRGVTHYAAGQFAAAAADLATSAELWPDSGAAPQVYHVLWLHLARAKAGNADPDELARNAREINPDRWPGMLIGLFLGDTKSEEVRAVAERDVTSPELRRIYLDCVVTFYIGEYELLRKHASAAKPMFEQAATACEPDAPEHTGAVAELMWMGKPQPRGEGETSGRQN